MQFDKVKVALIGSGNISYTYLNTLTTQFNIIDMVGCSDLIPEKSKARAELFGIRQMTNEEILNDPEIEIVLNTTEIFNHTAVSKMILEAGKSVYSEKAMGRNYAEAKANVDLAAAKGVRLGSAPDIYMGAAYQTARKLIDDGWIGQPLNAFAICIRQGWAGNMAAVPSNPMYGGKGNTMPYDMGGYYVNALVSLLGPVKRVSGYARSFADRVYENPVNPQFLEPVKVNEGSSMMMGCLEHDNGTYSNLILCSEGFNPEIPRVEIFGTKGTLVIPDPNCFGGYGLDVYLTRVGNTGTFKVPFTHAYGDSDPAIPAKSGKREPCYNSNRGIAVADMAYAIRQNRPHRSSAELALHTVEIISAIEQCNEDNQVHIMQSHPVQPAPLKHGMFGPAAEASLIL